MEGRKREREGGLGLAIVCYGTTDGMDCVAMRRSAML